MNFTPAQRIGQSKLGVLQVFGVFAFRMISKKVDLLIRQCGFSSSDRDDLYQEFSLNLLVRRDKFDPSVGKWEAFVVVVCENHFVTLLARRCAEKRSRRREEASFDDHRRRIDGGPFNRVPNPDERSHARRTGQRFRDRRESWEMMHDVETVVRNLPLTQRSICSRLMRVNVSETARELGVSRARVMVQIEAIRQRFEQAGLRDYL
jgi:RNA polymerase sigma factor (sigma-70 family)